MKELTTTQFTSYLYKDKDNNKYTYTGCKALATYFKEIEEDLGVNLNLDRVGIRSEYSQYCDYLDVNDELNLIDFSDEDEDLSDLEKEELVKNYLEQRTIIIEFEDGIIIQDF